MARVWSTAWRSSLSGRVLLAYLTLAVLVAVAGPGVAAVAAGGPPDGGGDPGQAHIIVTKYNDANQNFVRDGGEAWLGGFYFELYSGPGPDGPWTLVGTGTTSSPNGQYQFGMFPFGWYKLTEVLSADQIAAGWVPTGGYASIIWQMTGEVNADLWFGNHIEEPAEPETGDLTIYKFEDLDEDGVWDEGELPLSGVEFTVAGIGTYSTDAAGEIELTGLEVGTYAVTETVPDGWDPTGPVTKDAVIVADGLTELYFGNIEEPAEPETGDLTIDKFHDLSKDGLYDEGEDGLEGVDFTIEGPNGYSNTGTTDANGEIHLTGLEPGEYTVTETLPEGWKNTTDLVQVVVVVAGEEAQVSFGNIEEPEPEPKPEPEPDDGDFLPYTPDDDEEDYLPFTGGEYALLLGAAAAAATLGGALRRRSDHTA